MSRRLIPVLLLLVGWGCCLSACAERQQLPYPDLRGLWVRFLELPDERALAIAGDGRVRWIGEISGGHPSRAEAEQSALAACNEKRLRRRMRAACRVYAVGDEVVGTPW